MLRTVHNLWIRVYASVLRVGEGDRHAQDEERLQEGTGEAARSDPDMVPSNNIPLLWSHQLHRRLPSR